MRPRTGAGSRVLLAACLAALALPAAAAERKPGEPTAGVPAARLKAAPKPEQPAPASAPGAEAKPDVEAAYTAARKAADKRQEEWDRRMRQIVKDVCTGC